SRPPAARDRPSGEKAAQETSASPRRTERARPVAMSQTGIIAQSVKASRLLPPRSNPTTWTVLFGASNAPRSRPVAASQTRIRSLMHAGARAAPSQDDDSQ